MATNEVPPPAVGGGHRWIVGVDGSELAELALNWAVVHAGRHRATVRVVNVWQARIGDPSHAPLEHLRGRAEAILASMRDVIETTHPGAEFVTEYGSPAERLLELADDADLLIVGTRGLGGFRRLLLGSTSHQCAAHSTVPVVVVPRQSPITKEIGRIVVGVDGSPNARAALRWALRFAAPDTTVEAVGVGEPSTPAVETDAEHLPSRARESFDQSIDDVEADEPGDSRVHRVFEYGKPAVVLGDRASTADLLVVGARGQGGIAAALLGSVSYKVLHRTTVPVVIVPEVARWKRAAN